MLPDLKSIRTRREKLGIKLVTLSKATEIKPSMLSMIENGKVPNAGYEKVRKISEYLDKHGEIQLGKKAGEICSHNVVRVSTQDTLEKARDIMLKFNFSQLPVCIREECMGLITEHAIMNFIVNHDNKQLKTAKVKAIMEIPPPIISPDYPINQEIAELLRYSKCILVSKGNKIGGIITPTDTIKRK